MTKDSNVEAVINSIREREERGMSKYGVNTDRTDLSTLEWLQHLQEELMDGAVYIERIKKELQQNNTPTPEPEKPWHEGHEPQVASHGDIHEQPVQGEEYENYGDGEVEHQKWMKARDNYTKRMYMEEGQNEEKPSPEELAYGSGWTDIKQTDQGDYEYANNSNIPEHIKIPTDDD